MEKRLIFDNQLINITISRLCHELIENHQSFDNSAILGLQPRGIFLAERLRQRLQDITRQKIALGYLDVTFYRDDFRRSDIKANATKIDFVVEGREVILVDDVLYTGRTVRAAMDAMTAFGRPEKVELLTLIDRKYTRHLPVEANYVGRQVNTLQSQRIKVEWKEQGAAQDSIWLVEQEDEA
ncbi:bifunctional pyr operon transcriptional regulator/uracil phosphoribosyltransferase PyrR [Microscilla marina]|uniref:PyrR bifunctional protein n=1 Tax=Microscilla marina ATCC 23134 TaxID=313606 RepID=A1ZCE4_MICM2|nr:bifunctional pyr operon transcriptional regulator/uracil phosphoribosyltransferase PyrR [Microscilla marina]EAY31946.1 PyrR bifunctional protein [Microscilla marina ATCC 23134]